MRRLFGLAAALGCFCAPLAGAAQELRGTLRLGDGVAPAVGVIVEALLPGTSTRVASTLTDGRGYFVLQLNAGQRVSARALRIGQRPTLLGDFTLGEGEVRSADAVLSGASIVLDRVQIVGRSVCRVASDSTLAALTLLDEARKALRATQLTSTQGELTASWRLTSERTTLRGDPVGTPTVREYRSRTNRPFVSLPPDSLAQSGYLHATDDEYTYFAPDADVLLSERFVEDHCFRTEPWTRDSRDWVGMGFSPARGAGDVVGIAGTIWLDRQTAELKLLEFRYVNLPRVLRGAPAGGEVEFLRLPTGAWLVRRWSIRMPRPTDSEEPIFRGGIQVGTTRTTRLRVMEVAGGEVQEIRAAREVLFQAEAGGVLVRPVTAFTTMAELCPTAPGSFEAVLWGTVRDSSGTPRAGVGLRVEWRQNVRWLAEWQRGWDTRRVVARSASDGLWIACGVPRGEPIEISLDAEEKPTPQTIRVPREVGGLEHDVVIAPSSVARGSIVGVLRDSLRSLGAWVGADVRVLGGSWRAVSDSLGRFRIDSVPLGRHELIVTDDELQLLRVPLIAAAVEVRADETATVTLATPSPETRFRSVCGRARVPGEGVLLGELRDLGTARRAGLPVEARWTRSFVSRETSERRERVVADTSDASGWFRLCGVPTEGEASTTGDVTVYFSGEVQLSAGSAALGSDPIGVRLDGSVLRRRDLVVGGARDRMRLSGRVLDHLGLPLEGATVVVGGVGGRSVLTSASGLWTIDSVPVRTTTIAIRALRFSPFARELDPIGGRLHAGEVRLELAPQVLAASVTTASGGLGPQAARAAFDERRRAYGFGTFIDDAAVARQPVPSPGWLRSQIPKSRLGTMGALTGKQKIGFEVDSGFGAMGLCFPRWFVDGVDFGVPEADEEERWLRSARRVEAYKATQAPPQYNDFNGCGVILVWTR